MPRSGSRSRSSFGSSSSRPYSSYAPAAPPASARPQPQTAGGGAPSMMRQAGAVAGGVVAGNLITNALLGPRVVVMEDGRSKEVVDPCARELQNFVDCARKNADLRDCEGLNEVLKACRKQFGPPPGPT